MRRRLTFTTVALVSQLLLIALAIAWLVHMLTITANGSISFVENNPLVLWGEITATALITLFAIRVFALQIVRLGERRRSEDKDEVGRGEGTATVRFAQERTNGRRTVETVVGRGTWSRPPLA